MGGGVEQPFFMGNAIGYRAFNPAGEKGEFSLVLRFNERARALWLRRS